MIAGRLPLVPRYRQKVRDGPLRPRARRSGSTTRTSTSATTCGARPCPARRRRRALRPHRPVDVPAAGPQPPAVGVLAGRGPGRPPLGADLARSTTAWSTGSRAPTSTRVVLDPAPSRARPSPTPGRRCRNRRRPALTASALLALALSPVAAGAHHRRRAAPPPGARAAPPGTRPGAPWRCPPHCCRPGALAVRPALGAPAFRLLPGDGRRRRDGAPRGRRAPSTTSILAAVTGGYRDLLLSRGEQPDRHAVRTLVPVSVRTPGEESIRDNRVSLMLAEPPGGRRRPPRAARRGPGPPRRAQSRPGGRGRRRPDLDRGAGAVPRSSPRPCARWRACRSARSSP